MGLAESASDSDDEAEDGEAGEKTTRARQHVLHLVVYESSRNRIGLTRVFLDPSESLAKILTLVSLLETMCTHPEKLADETKVSGGALALDITDAAESVTLQLEAEVIVTVRINWASVVFSMVSAGCLL